MESKKGISPILLCLLVLVGSCLVGAGTWYALNYFKGNEVEKPESQSDNVYHDYIVYSSKDSENYKKVDYSKLFVLKPFDEALEEVLISNDNVITLSEKGYPSLKGKSLKVDEKITSALIDFNCAASISIYYLTESKKLYFADLADGENPYLFNEEDWNNKGYFKPHLVDTNVEKIGYSTIERFTTCGGDTIVYKKVDDNNNYIIHEYDNPTNMKYDNYDELLGDYSYLLVVYKNYPDKTAGKNPVVLKDSRGKDLYVKGAFVSSEQLKKGYNYIYLLGEDDYLYHFPNGYSANNVKASKYSKTKVKKVTYNGTNDNKPSTLTIEYANGKKEDINIDAYYYVNLDL